MTNRRLFAQLKVSSCGLFLALTGFSGAAHSQENSQNPKLTLAEQRVLAVQEMKAAEAKIEALAKAPGKEFDVCEITKLRYTIEHDLWFLENYEEFVRLEQSFTHSVQDARAQLQELGKISVRVNPKRGQNDEVEITLEAAISYLKHFNDRWTNTPADQRPLLLEVQNDPKMNPPLFVAHDQIIDGVKMMSEIINAGLKQKRSEFVFNFLNAESGLDLVMQSKAPGGEVLSTYSFLQGRFLTQSQAQQPERDLWAFYFSKNTLVNGQSLHPRKRLIEAQKNWPKNSCTEKFKFLNFYDEFQNVFVTFTDLLRQDEKLVQKMGAMAPYLACVNDCRLSEPPANWQFEPLTLIDHGVEYEIGIHESWGSQRIYFGMKGGSAYVVRNLVNYHREGQRREVVMWKGLPALKYEDQFGNIIVVSPAVSTVVERLKRSDRRR